MSFNQYRNNNINNHIYQRYKNFSASANVNISSTRAVVKSALFQNLDTTNVLYFQLHNTTSTIGGGDVPIDVIALNPGESVELDHIHFGPDGMAFSSGLSFGLSSTLGTFTAAGSPNCNVLILWDFLT